MFPEPSTATPSGKFRDAEIAAAPSPQAPSPRPPARRGFLLEPPEKRAAASMLALALFALPGPGPLRSRSIFNHYHRHQPARLGALLDPPGAIGAHERRKDDIGADQPGFALIQRQECRGDDRREARGENPRELAHPRIEKIGEQGGLRPVAGRVEDAERHDDRKPDQADIAGTVEDEPERRER